MEVVEAVLTTIDDKYFISIGGDPTILIPISDDDANAVKSAFNLLIERLKRGAFSINFQGSNKDLFNQVAQEYIEQLNGELADVYEEMKTYGFAN
ncbi:hypothetical protein [Amphritea sp.]|uniref:hypothetical protein n=1 Tax=Amphritea sp. TaxID=1872502 RepID=UPI003D0F59A1